MASWLQRRKAHRRLRDQVGLWYHPQYRVEELGETARVPGVEVARGEKILGSLGAEGLIRPKQVRPAPLIALAELGRVHSATYLEKTAHPEYLGRIFGLEADDAGYLSIVFDVAGIAGAMFAGWASDRFFKARRAKIAFLMLVGMMLSCLLMYSLGATATWIFATSMGLTGVAGGAPGQEG